MTFFREWCGMKFYMPLKPTKWGFELHSLVDSKTHYLYDVILDPWKEHKELLAPDKEMNYSRQIILSFAKKLDKGNLFIYDSRYNSIALCNDLTKF